MGEQLPLNERNKLFYFLVPDIFFPKGKEKKKDYLKIEFSAPEFFYFPNFALFLVWFLLGRSHRM